MIPNVHKGGLHISFPFLASPFFPSSNLSDHRFVDVMEPNLFLALNAKLNFYYANSTNRFLSLPSISPITYWYQERIAFFTDGG